MKKVISLILLLTVFAFVFSACNTETLGIEGREWEMRTAMQSYTVLAIGEENEAYPDTSIVEMTLTASDGAVTITDITNNKVYTGTYRVLVSAPNGTTYEMTLEGITGTATVSMTEYDGGGREATLPISIGEYTLYFYEKA